MYFSCIKNIKDHFIVSFTSYMLLFRTYSIVLRVISCSVPKYLHIFINNLFLFYLYDRFGKVGVAVVV